MANLYHVLQVDAGASPVVLSAAYQALRADAVSRGDADRTRELDEAFATLGNPEERRRYDESLAEAATAPEAALTPASSEPDSAERDPAAAFAAYQEARVLQAAEAADAVTNDDAGDSEDATRDPAAAYAAYQEEQARLAATQPPPQKSLNRGLLFATLGMIAVLIGLIGVGMWFLLFRDSDTEIDLLLFKIGGDGREYTTQFSEEGDDFIQFLAAMALREEDVPEGIELLGEASFNNQEWADAIDDEDPEAKQRQLDAQGRVRNFLSLYQNPALEAGSTAALGRPFSFTSQSSVFNSVEAAEESLRTTCDIELGDTDIPSALKAPKLGDASSAFEVRTVVDNFGNELVDTTVCFRTGRIVHSVSQRGLEGTESLDLSISLARKMLEHVNGAFEGDRRDPDLPDGG